MPWLPLVVAQGSAESLEAIGLGLPALSQDDEVLPCTSGRAVSALSDSAITMALAGSTASTSAKPRARVALIHCFTVFILETS